ncbi:MAG: hypothetical protein CFH06_00457 [Alphaproteobacteria bacterium MarineAlpha3_Bin5]|nr:hypothetical protein [Magnetovibrio sp.]PPR79240.1 MAG: hypothetical protein CFH06_00457 [Alphaproteobacteria bacterium MarineAlpha3_Bin5]
MKNSVPQNVFPIIRCLSRPVTQILRHWPISPNFVTTLSLFAGLGASFLLASPWILGRPIPFVAIAASILLVICYILDNCDGEIARIKNQCTTFGLYYDSFVDWIVHASFFVCLGLGAAATNGEISWSVLGWVAGFGATVNYVVGIILDSFDAESVVAREGGDHQPKTNIDWAIYIFRELSRADFCFIVLLLSLANLLWVLLPLGAVGSQVYWITQFNSVSRRFHV